MSRKPLTALGLLLAAPLAGVSAIEGAWFVAAQQAQAKGVEIGARQGNPFSRTWTDLTREPVHVDRLEWSLSKPTQLQLSGVEIRIQTPDSGTPSAPSDQSLAPPQLPSWVTLNIQDLALILDGEQVGERLSGTWTPTLASLSAADGTQVLLPGPTGQDMLVVTGLSIPLDGLSGWLEVTATQAGERLSMDLRSENLVAEHPNLSKRPLSLPLLTASISGTLASKQADGSFVLGGMTGTLHADCTQDCVVRVVVPDQPAAQVLSVVAPLVPELQRATVLGLLGGELTLNQDGSWVLDPHIGQLEVHGAVPDLGSLRRGRFRYRVRKADGSESTRTSGEGSRGWVPLRQVSPHLRAAVLAAEDSAFTSHNGIDPQNIRDALADNQEAGTVVRGGSTLTQQLAKNLFLDGERTMERKLREALLAVELDRELGKDRVLELYVNIVEWGPDVWGIGPASDLYFLRDASNLPPNEAAFLAALLPSPKRYYKSWYLGGRERRGTVQRILDNMYYGGALSKDDAKKWGKAPLRPIPPPGD
ncbi:MAG: hypothetical protein ACI9VR_005086 [Cognaticolwellia sp.]